MKNLAIVMSTLVSTAPVMAAEDQQNIYIHGERDVDITAERNIYLNASDIFVNGKSILNTADVFRGINKSIDQSVAIGLAAAGLSFDQRPGKLSVTGGFGNSGGETAFSGGLGYTIPNGKMRFNVSATTAGDRHGVNGGASLTLN